MPWSWPSMLEWFQQNKQVLWWASIVSAALYAAILISLPIVAAKVPRDFFKHGYRSPFRYNHPVLDLLFWLLRNVTALVLALTGAVMLVLPGPGVAVLLMSLLVSTLPARRSLLRMALRRRPVLAAFNWLRQRKGAEPLLLTDLARRTGRKGLGALLKKGATPPGSPGDPAPRPGNPAPPD